MRFSRELQIGIDIHRLIVAISGNEILSSLLNGILDKRRNYVWMEMLWTDEWKIARIVHATIVEEICNGNAP